MMVAKIYIIPLSELKINGGEKLIPMAAERASQNGYRTEITCVILE